MELLKKTHETQQKIEERARRVGKGKYGRVLTMAVKPDNEELAKALQIVTIGILIIGFLGFGIYFIWKNLPGALKDYLGL